MRSLFQCDLCWYLSSSLPIGLWISIPPAGLEPIRFSNLVSHIHADHSFVVFVSFGKFSDVIEKHVLRVLSRPPQAVPIIVGTTPLWSTSMVIENNHKADISQCLDSDVEYLHRGFADEIGVSLQVLLGDDIVVIDQLKGVCESDTVHFKLEADIHRNILEGSALESVNTMPAHMPTWPVSPR